MKKIFKTVLAISAGLAATSCASWLETSSPSVVDADFVFSDFSTGKDVMLGAYDTYVGLVNEGPLMEVGVCMVALAFIASSSSGSVTSSRVPSEVQR